MTGAFSQTTLEPNSIELARQKRLGAGLPLLDLTDANPTHAGILFPPEILRKAAAPYWNNRLYQPSPRGLPAAREAVAQYYATRCEPISFPPDDIFLTASTSEAYQLLFQLLCDPGDNVLVPSVTYPLFDLFADVRGVELRSYRLEESNGWQCDDESIRRAADRRTRAIFLISPHNPTGAIQKRRLESLSDIGIPIIADEVFSEFVWSADPLPSIPALYPDLPVFLLNGISKMLALPDMKLGWIALNATAARAYGVRLELLNDILLSANQLTQSMLPTLLVEGRPFIDEMRRVFQGNFSAVMDIFGSASTLRCAYPSGGMFLFPELPPEMDEETAVLTLLDLGVFVHPGYFYGNEGRPRLMISTVPHQGILREGAQTIAAAFR